MAVSEWTEPGQYEVAPGMRRLQMMMTRPNNRTAMIVMYNSDDSNMNTDDWQAFLDHLATFPGAFYVAFGEGSGVSRAVTPDVDYEPLPTPPLD